MYLTVRCVARSGGMQEYLRREEKRREEKRREERRGEERRLRIILKMETKMIQEKNETRRDIET
jgi:predicted ATPase